MVVLGVDGGNSKTEAVIADRDGTVLGSSRGGNTDIYGSGDPEGAIAELVGTTTAAMAGAGMDAADLAAATFSLAGADWPEDIALLETELAARLGLPPACSLLVVNDAMGGMRTGAPAWEGIAVVCGTFNAVGARHRDGRMFHLGFWPDRTGGYDLAHDVLKAVYRDGLDLGPATALTPLVLERFGVGDAIELMHAFTRRGSLLGSIALDGLAALLLDVAEGGDPVAAGLVTRAGRWLGEEGRVSAQRVGLDVAGAPVVLTGGVLQHPSTQLVDAVMDRLPGGVPVRPTAPPVVGALLLCFDRTGIEADPDALASGVSTQQAQQTQQASGRPEVATGGG